MLSKITTESEKKLFKNVPCVQKILEGIKITSLVIALLSIVVSIFYIYLGAVGSAFPSWGSSFLVTMGSLGIVTTLALLFLASFALKKAIGEAEKQKKHFIQAFSKGLPM